MLKTTNDKLCQINGFFNELRKKLAVVVEDFRFDSFILSIILLNAFVLGAMTFPEVYLKLGRGLIAIDYLCVVIFIIELGLKIFVMRKAFFKDNWNIFDFTVVALSLVPNTGAFIIIRTFRVFRVLRLLSVMPSMRRVLTMFLETLPSVFSTIFLMVIVFYIFGVMAVYLFGSFLVDFSTLSLAVEALFGFLTFEGWSSEKAQLAMSVYPYSWLFFLSFVTIFLLMIVNVFTSAVVEGVKNIKSFDKEKNEKLESLIRQQDEIAALLKECAKK